MPTYWSCIVSGNERTTLCDGSRSAKRSDQLARNFYSSRALAMHRRRDQLPRILRIPEGCYRSLRYAESPVRQFPAPRCRKRRFAPVSVCESEVIEMDVNFFDWSYLGSFTGALVAVTLLTEMIKALPVVKRIPTQLVSWVLALVVLVLAQLFTGTLDAQNVVLSVLNAAMVSLAANGGYAAVKRLFDSSVGKEE